MSIPVESTIPSVLKAHIKINEVELFKCLNSTVLVYNKENQLILTKDVVIDGDEYNNWTDDAILEDLILSKVDLKKKQSPISPTGASAPTGPTGPADPVSEEPTGPTGE
jgi:hypothetical protein